MRPGGVRGLCGQRPDLHELESGRGAGGAHHWWVQTLLSVKTSTWTTPVRPYGSTGGISAVSAIYEFTTVFILPICICHNQAYQEVHGFNMNLGFPALCLRCKLGRISTGF